MNNKDLIDIEIKKLLNEFDFDPREGLPEELFLLISSLTPIPNVDLMVLDDKNRILLSWRDDKYFGRGWHIPGGCIRLHETMYERIVKTSLSELGTKDLIVDEKPLLVKDAIKKKNYEGKIDQFVRSHNIAILFLCHISNEYNIASVNKGKKEYQNGFLKWFESMPEDVLPAVRDTYGYYIDDYLDNLRKGKE